MAAAPGHLNDTQAIDKAKALLQSLAPRAQCFCVYDAKSDCTWSSDGVEDGELDQFVADLPSDLFGGEDPEPFVHRTLKSGRTAFAMPVVSTGGLMVVLFSRNAGKSAGFNPGMLRDILAPAVDIIAERQTHQRQLNATVRDQERLFAELKLVYDIDERIHGDSRSHAGLAKLVGQSGRFLEIAYSVLLIPAKRIRISATHSTWRNVNRKVIDRYLIDHMLPKLDGRTQPAIFEIPPFDDGSGITEQGYQTLLCPILDRQGVVEGVLAQLGRVNHKPFDDGHRRFMSHIGRKVEYVIEQSFDAMTGLMNREGFEAQVRESHKALSASNDTHQLIYFDIDNLKLVNDKFDAQAGDEVVTRMAALLGESLPKTAVLSRLEGDEFCILLTHASEDAAVELAEAARDRCRDLRYLKGDQSLQITISVGVSEFNESNGLNGEALTAARMACDSAKEHGRDRVHVYDGANQSMIRRMDDMNLVAEIQRALDSDGFELLAQPIMSLSSPEDVIRYEILLRMSNAAGDPIPTHSFLSAAERYQMMPQIDRWVVSQAISLLADNVELLEDRGARFCINLSGQSLSDDAMLAFILEEIDTVSVPVSLLGFEITESAAVMNLGKAQLFIQTLHDKGCKISLDDFGAGLSSFAYLKNFCVDTLKIDGSFIRDITDNRISESMVAAITQVAKVMELETVAEYVETESIRSLIERLGVDFAQGHGIGRPAPLTDVLQRLSDVSQPWIDPDNKAD
ncbi:MAG: EAL domain-containing protein [Pseudomonadota bacterium]